MRTCLENNPNRKLKFDGLRCLYFMLHENECKWSPVRIHNSTFDLSVKLAAYILMMPKNTWFHMRLSVFRAASSSPQHTPNNMIIMKWFKIRRVVQPWERTTSTRINGVFLILLLVIGEYRVSPWQPQLQDLSISLCFRVLWVNLLHVSRELMRCVYRLTCRGPPNMCRLEEREQMGQWVSLSHSVHSTVSGG